MYVGTPGSSPTLVRGRIPLLAPAEASRYISATMPINQRQVLDGGNYVRVIFDLRGKAEPVLDGYVLSGNAESLLFSDLYSVLAAELARKE